MVSSSGLRARFGWAWCVGVCVLLRPLRRIPDSLPQDSLPPFPVSPSTSMEPLRLRWAPSTFSAFLLCKITACPAEKTDGTSELTAPPIHENRALQVLVLWAQASLPQPCAFPPARHKHHPTRTEVPRQGTEGGESRKWWLRVSGRHLPWLDGCFGGVWWRWPRPQGLC